MGGGLKTETGNFLLHFPLPFRICGGVYKIFLDPTPKIFILIVKFSNTTPLPLTILWGGF